MTEEKFTFFDELKLLTREYLETALWKTEGNKHKAAEALGMNRTTLLAMMKRLDITEGQDHLSRMKLEKLRHEAAARRLQLLINWIIDKEDK